MKSKMNLFAMGIVVLVGMAIAAQSSCTSEAEAKITPEKKELSKSELIARGQYLTTVSLCNDCHSPKVFGPHGMGLDSTKLFSGHPAGSPLPAFDKSALKPGSWILFSGDLTASVGPWGMSFAANLTPDSTTGIGAWSEETFIKTLRTGKHLGQEGGRPIMPPMPWEMVRNMTDEDLKAIYTYLQALPPVKNQVPAPIAPDEAAKMKM
ncbi:MAG TPA: c-type cytochrome [Chitinophagaceae bacterium]|nr:c-type cytochrome [Chitinophagaceae bacterium]